ncbi:MAG: glycosyltransferase family 4 protein [Myxococcales bacterium]|nr:glycosyltransferase family 4 protein [Myxococcales bacterium]
MGIAGKKILLTTTHQNIRSGGSIQLSQLARALTAAGARVEALFNYRAGADRESSNLTALEQAGVAVRFLRFNRWYHPAQIWRLRDWLRRGAYDIVHTHKGSDLSLVLLAGAGLPIPCVVNTRGVNFRLGLNRYKYRSRRLDRIIVVSQDSRRVMVDCGVPADKIRVIYGGADTERFRPLPAERAPVRAEWSIPPDALVSVVAANLVRQKGHGDYLEAAAALRAAHPELWHVFAGGGDQAPWRERAAELGVADRVIFAGFRRDMERVYAAADLSVMPSFAGEGVSGVLREAMACGLPVITTDVGGNAELVRDGETGLVVPIRQPAALAGALQRLVVDRELAARLAGAGAALVRSQFSVAHRMERILALYEEVFRDKGLPF